MLDVLGLADLLDVADVEPPAEVIELVEQRERARAAREFGQADALRKQVRELGWEVRDGPEGPDVFPPQ
jgi:cysteinyl-tRNA synthetase